MSNLLGNPEDRFSRIVAYLIMVDDNGWTYAKMMSVLQVRRQEPNITRGITTCKYIQYRAMFV